MVCEERNLRLILVTNQANNLPYNVRHNLCLNELACAASKS